MKGFKKFIFVLPKLYIIQSVLILNFINSVDNMINQFSEVVLLVIQPTN